MFLGTDDQRIVRFRQAKEGMGTPLQGFPNAQPNFTRPRADAGNMERATGHCDSGQIHPACKYGHEIEGTSLRTIPKAS